MYIYNMFIYLQPADLSSIYRIYKRFIQETLATCKCYEQIQSEQSSSMSLSSFPSFNPSISWHQVGQVDRQTDGQSVSQSERKGNIVVVLVNVTNFSYCACCDLRTFMVHLRLWDGNVVSAFPTDLSPTAPGGWQAAIYRGPSSARPASQSVAPVRERDCVGGMARGAQVPVPVPGRV